MQRDYALVSVHEEKISLRSAIRTCSNIGLGPDLVGCCNVGVRYMPFSVRRDTDHVDWYASFHGSIFESSCVTIPSKRGYNEHAVYFSTRSPAVSASSESA